jgi:uncharacterized membrane protein
LLKSDKKAPKPFNIRLQDSTTMSKKLLAFGVILVIAGFVLVIAGFVLPEIPLPGFLGFISSRELDKVCKSLVGDVLKAFLPQLQIDCGKAALALQFSQILIRIGVVTLVVGVVTLAVGLIKMARSPKTGSNQTQKPEH